MEPSVFVEIDIKEMNTLDIFNQFIGLWTHYHLNRCKMDLNVAIVASF